MNVTIEFNAITRDSQQAARVGTLHAVDLDQAVSMSMAMQDNPEVEAVIMVEGDREPSRLARLARQMGTAASCWLWNLQQPRARTGAERPGRLAEAA
jgi:hypothetical protein